MMIFAELHLNLLNTLLVISNVLMRVRLVCACTELRRL